MYSCIYTAGLLERQAVDYYLSHCYSIAWDRLKSLASVCHSVILSVCL